MTETLTRSREWLLLNAVEAWLHHYENAGTPTVAQYKQLRDEFHDAYMLTLRKDAEEIVEDEAPEPTRTTRKRSTTSKQ
jgi:hypothetical protein